MKFKSLFALCLVTTLSGCGPRYECTPDTRVDLEVAKYLVESPSLKVLVRPIEVSSSLSIRLSKEKLDEITRNARNAKHGYLDQVSLESEADFILETNLDLISYSDRFHSARSYTNDEGESKTIPASCSFEVDVETKVRIVDGESQEVVKEYAVTGDMYRSLELSDSTQDCELSARSLELMTEKALEEAIKYDFELSEFFAPRASVVEARHCYFEFPHLVKIEMGKKKGVRAGDDIDFYQTLMDDDGELYQDKIGSGYVLNNEIDAVTQKYSWVVVDEELGLIIEKGTIAKLARDLCGPMDIECQIVRQAK